MTARELLEALDALRERLLAVPSRRVVVDAGPAYAEIESLRILSEHGGELVLEVDLASVTDEIRREVQWDTDLDRDDRIRELEADLEDTRRELAELRAAAPQSPPPPAPPATPDASPAGA